MRSVASALTVGMNGLLTIVSGMALSLELGSGGSQRMVRRQGDTIMAEDGKLMSGTSYVNDLTCDFNNGDFEFITQSTDTVGDPLDTHVLAAPDSTCPSTWNCVGSVVQVPSGNAAYGGMPSPGSGGVHVAIPSGATISQTVGGHKSDHVYQLSFMASNMPKPCGTTAADGTCFGPLTETCTAGTCVTTAAAGVCGVGCTNNQCCGIDFPQAVAANPTGCACGKIEVHLTGAESLTCDLLAHPADATIGGAGEPDYMENVINLWANQDFVYKPSSTNHEVTITIKNTSPTGITVLLDKFDLSVCDSAGDCTTCPAT